MSEAKIEWLDYDRQKKAADLKNPDEKARSILAGLLLRHAFLESGHDAGEWAHVRTGKGQYGKPYIEGYEKFHYSLSHSGRWAVCAADLSPVGADIQEMKAWKPELAKRFYNEEEYNRLLAQGGLDINIGTLEFYKMWTAKESAVKLIGRGIGAGIGRYVTDEGYSRVHDLNMGQEFLTRLYDTVGGYMICVCSKTGNFPDKLEIINFGGDIC